MQHEHSTNGEPDGDNVPPVSVEQFQFAIQLADAAMYGRMSMTNLASVRSLFDDPLTIDDSPESQMLKVLAEHFGSDWAAYRAIVLRMFAMCEMWQHSGIEEWVRPNDNDHETIVVSDALIEVAATMDLNAFEGFDPAAFFSQVRQVAECKENE
jgi:hypothetical protein